MKYAKDTRPKGASHKAAEVLVEALPWIKNITGKTVVIKYGGSAMVDEQLRADVMNDIVLLKIVGVNPVIVHGGGKAITEAMDFLQLPVEFKDGQRVTTPEAMDLVRTVLMGKVNQELVEALNEHGNFAVGVSGADAGVIVAEQASPELGRVGRITRINSPLLDDLVAGDYIPVVASVALGEDGTVYAATQKTGSVAAHVTAISAQCVKRWEHAADGDINGVPAVDDQGFVYYNDRTTGKLVKLRPEDGSRVAEIKLADELRSSPTISYDGTIYVNGMKDDKPTVFAVKGAAEGCAASWSQQGGNPSKTEYMY